MRSDRLPTSDIYQRFQANTMGGMANGHFKLYEIPIEGIVTSGETQPPQLTFQISEPETPEVGETPNSITQILASFSCQSLVPVNCYAPSNNGESITVAPTSTCTYRLYWDDGLNPTRVLEIDADNPARNEYTDPNSTIPWIQDCNIIDSCNICVNTPDLDCDKIRLAPFMLPICPRLENGVSGGNILNGSYLIAMAYAVKGQ